MSHNHPTDELRAELEALNTVFEAGDREDRRREAQRRREGLPEPERGLRTFEGFADSGAASRG